MSEPVIKEYLFASDFDQTLSFNDSGLVLSEVLGIPAQEFERKAEGMARLNLVQQGAELSYLLLHDPQFRHVRREHLIEAGKRIPLKEHIDLLYKILDKGVSGYHFNFYVLSAAPAEIVQSALEDIVPANHIYGTEFKYSQSGEIETLVRATAGFGKVARLAQLQEELQIGPDRVVYAGDGSSDVHAMLHVNRDAGLTIAVSESRNVTQIARRTVLSANALAMLAPILEEVAGWQAPEIQEFFEGHGFLVREWARARTDWLTLRSTRGERADAAAI
jgi:2-hydroxy-3-keto-5-methylthiopentenyl-1-phosphate phosphatase